MTVYIAYSLWDALSDQYWNIIGPGYVRETLLHDLRLPLTNIVQPVVSSIEEALCEIG